jgi:hypothetical protein
MYITILNHKTFSEIYQLLDTSNPNKKAWNTLLPLFDSDHNGSVPSAGISEEPPTYGSQLQANHMLAIRKLLGSTSSEINEENMNALNGIQMPINKPIRAAENAMGKLLIGKMGTQLTKQLSDNLI